MDTQTATLTRKGSSLTRTKAPEPEDWKDNPADSGVAGKSGGAGPTADSLRTESTSAAAPREGGDQPIAHAHDRAR
jgi:hypothetical protein